MSKTRKTTFCGHISPTRGLICQKPWGHHDTDKVTTHQAGSITWGDRAKTENLPAHTPGLLNEQYETRGYFNHLIHAVEDPTPRVVTFSTTLDEGRFEAAAKTPLAPADQLAEWWRDTAENEIEQTVDKAVEYGSTDLVDIGQALARVAGRTIPDSEAAEWGIFFYLEGKLARWRSAIQRGDLPSFDTLLDIGVYARMAQRVRQEGSWPGTADHGTSWADKKINIEGGI